VPSSFSTSVGRHGRAPCLVVAERKTTNKPRAVEAMRRTKIKEDAVRMKESPEYVKLSLAASMQLGYSPARFYRAAKMTCINLLLTYAEGCAGNCSYCGLARERKTGDERSFIRVPWPVKEFDDVVDRIASSKVVKRVCISMVTHKRSLGDTLVMAAILAEKTDKCLSALISPTIIDGNYLAQLRDSGVDKIGIAFDLPTQELFDAHRGKDVRGPHEWKRYWSLFAEGIEIFGEGNVGSHFIVGLGETERDMVFALQRVRNLGGVNHLFSFYPEEGSALTDVHPPPISKYRRIQIACELIDSGLSAADSFGFDKEGEIENYGISQQRLDEVIASGKPFRTRGCVGNDGEVACNRPYANSLPGDEIRNYPFSPTEEDVAAIRSQIEEKP